MSKCKHDFDAMWQYWECPLCRMSIREYEIQCLYDQLASTNEKIEELEKENEQMSCSSESARIVALWNDLRRDLGLTHESTTEQVRRWKRRSEIYALWEKHDDAWRTLIHEKANDENITAWLRSGDELKAARQK